MGWLLELLFGAIREMCSQFIVDMMDIASGMFTEILFKMLFLLAERYVLLGIFSYTSPLAFATGGSKATNNILASWTKMFGGQVMIVILDAWCVKMFLSGYGNLMASSYGFTKFFAATMCLIGFCKITGKLDSYMGSLGVNLGRSGGGLSGLGALMMAGRLLHGGGRAAAGTLGNVAAGHMNFGTGKSIPLGKGSLDPAAGGKNSRWPFQGSGIGGMKDGMGDAGTAKGPGKEDSAAPWKKNGYGEFVPDGQNIDDQNLPFGNPEEAAWDFSSSAEDTNGMNAGETQGADGFADMGGFKQTDGLDHLSSEMGDAEQGIPEPVGEAGNLSDGENIIPFMDMSEGGPFGMPMDGSAEGFRGTEDSEPVMDSPTEMDGIQLRSAVTGIYSSMAMEDSDVSAEGGISDMNAGDSYTAGNVYASGDAYGAAEGYGTENVHGISAGGEIPAGSSGSILASDNLSGTEQMPDGYGYTETGSYGHGKPDSYGISETSGMYEAERDGKTYMRYDAGLYERPDGEYQTIHENGKTFYELPEGEKAPAVLPQMKAVLEKNGNIRLEKTNHKETEKQNRYMPASAYAGNTSSEYPKQVPRKKN